MCCGKFVWTPSYVRHVVDLSNVRVQIDASDFLIFISALEDAKIAIAAAEFFISNAVRYSVSPEIFAGELQQLGFPKGMQTKHYYFSS